MILSDNELIANMETFVGHTDESLVNPASIDIRVGKTFILENGIGMQNADLSIAYYILEPGEFVLLETLETLTVPTNYAMDLRLKSSIARQGINHALAFWFDPGWHGVGTMEIFNQSRTMPFSITYGMRIAQIIVHELTSVPSKPYNGRYQNASGVEETKS